jgi:hypothetical protein
LHPQRLAQPQTRGEGRIFEDRGGAGVEGERIDRLPSIGAAFPLAHEQHRSPWCRRDRSKCGDPGPVLPVLTEGQIGAKLPGALDRGAPDKQVPTVGEQVPFQ